MKKIREYILASTYATTSKKAFSKFLADDKLSTKATPPT